LKESNDSSMSSVSVGLPVQQPQPLQQPQAAGSENDQDFFPMPLSAG
jgi:hypothetical protein